ncbi:MAG: hypothetical protein AAGI45_21815 [Cyanobacteria bacterium P01_H01_bin.26]
MRHFFFSGPMLVLVAVAGFANGDQLEETPSSAEIKAITEASSNQQCFRNEYVFEDNPDQKDVEWLAIEIDGDRAVGEYDWLPAFKDQRTGRFEGSVDGQIVSAVYEYTQEGQSGTTPISIKLESEQVVVEGGPLELGLNTTIARVDC